MSTFETKIGNIIRWNILAIAAIMPLLMSLWHYDAFDLPKIAFLYISTLVLITLVSIDMIALKGKITWVRTPLDLPILFFLVVTVISVVISEDPIASFVGEYGRYMTIQAVLAFAIIYQLTVQYIRDEKWLNRFLYVLFGVMTIMTVYGLAQGFGLDILPKYMQRLEQRTRSTLGNAIIFGAYLSFTIPILLNSLLDKKKTFIRNSRIQMWLAALAVLSFTNSIMTESRGPWLGLIFGLIALALLNAKRLKEDYSKLLAIVAIAALLAIFGFAVTSGGHPFSRIESIISRFADIPRMTGSAGARVEIWKESLAMFKANPILGYGIDQTQYHMLKFKTLKHALMEGPAIPDRAHNEYMQIGLDSGIAGLLAFFLIMIAAYQGWRKRSSRYEFYFNGLAAGFVGYLVQAITGITTIGNLGLLAVAAGVMASAVNPEPKIIALRLPRNVVIRSIATSLIGLIACFLIYVAAIPLEADVYMHSAVAKSLRSEYGRAVLVDDARNASRIWPYQGYYRNVLGRWLLDLAIEQQSSAFLEEAIKVAEDGIVYTPNDAGLYLIAGRGNLTLGRVQDDENYVNKGEAYLKLRLQLDPLDPLAAESLMRLYMGDGKYKEALSQLKVLLHYYPNDVRFLEPQALAYESLNDNVNANKTYKKIKQVKPDYPNIDINIERTSKPAASNR